RPESPRRTYRPFLVPTRSVTFFAITEPSLLTARYRRNHVNDVAVVEWRVLPAKEARVVLIDEEREMRTKFAVFVAQALGKARMGSNEPVQRLPDRPGVERQVACATGEAAVGAMQ